MYDIWSTDLSVIVLAALKH